MTYTYNWKGVTEKGLNYKQRKIFLGWFLEEILLAGAINCWGGPY